MAIILAVVGIVSAVYLKVFWAALAWLAGLIAICGYVANLEYMVGTKRTTKRTIQGLILVAGMGLEFIVLYPLWREEKAMATTGELEVDNSEDFDSLPIISFGPEGDGVSWSWSGPKDEPLMNIWGDRVIIRKVDGKIMLTTHVRDQDGKIVVDIDDNKWRVSPQSGISWDKNYSENALEVMDGRGQIVFQVVLVPNVVRIQGEWWTEDKRGARILRPYPFDREKVGPVFVTLSPQSHPQEPHIEPIFRYPSREHWGEYVDWFKQRPAPLQ